MKKKKSKYVMINRYLFYVSVVVILFSVVLQIFLTPYDFSRDIVITQSKIKNNQLIKTLSDNIVNDCIERYQRNTEKLWFSNASKEDKKIIEEWYNEDLQECKIYEISTWVQDNIEYESSMMLNTSNVFVKVRDRIVNRLYLDIDIYKILEEKKGDCRATAILTASLLNQQNITTYYAWQSGHMCLFVDISEPKEQYPSISKTTLESINCFSDEFYTLSSTRKIR